MKAVRFRVFVTLVTAVIFLLTIDKSSGQTKPQTAAGLIGQVTSAEEGPMEGVLVTAKKDGSTIAVTVVTDEKGQYSFPADRLQAGHYAIATRAIGYDLNGPKAVDIAAGGSKAYIKLTKTKNLANQLSKAEWLLS